MKITSVARHLITMAFLIGTDEAGYGPNLGPLTISGTSWENELVGDDLYDTLSDVVSQQSGKIDKIQICDSKAIYNSSGSIEKLETAVLSVLFALCDRIPENIFQLGEILGTKFNSYPHDSFAEVTNGLSLPVVANEENIKRLGTRFRSCCQSKQVRLVEVKCRALFPDQFNALVNQCGNKAEMLSAETLRIVAQLSKGLDAEQLVVCDKHGGRSKYLGLINEHLTSQFVKIDSETRSISQYLWNEDGHDVTIRFQAKGESFLPTAFSSMIAKYSRELCMNIWNDFWCARIPDLHPTKGYPVDAKRFRNEISELQKQLGISDELIWRVR